ncbi:hypothetical protein GGR54DRAFT_340768 [Hypoxylon sp. NC1633]|nr:hypothetical protein GGR54DRAFT_340768 [Hypoxylon sp. NC1633]
MSQVDANVENVRIHLTRKEDVDILRWLTPVDYSSQQNDFVRRRQAGTGRWLLSSKEYQKWLSDIKQTLFCPGIPGAGKTILASIVIEDLITRATEDQTIGIAYIYCNFRRKDEQTIESILSNLLKQLAQTRSSLPQGVKDLYDKNERTRMKPALVDILRVLRSVLALYSRVFVVIDAVDEYKISHPYWSSLLSDIFALQADTGLNLFVTSRHIPEIVDFFKGCLTHEVLATDEDVRKYIDGHIERLPRFALKTPGLREEIKDRITRATQGMFLLAQLYLDSLMDKTSSREIRNALVKLKKRPSRDQDLSHDGDVLDHAYDRTMERIDHQPPGFRYLGRKVITWITCAKRLLRPLELQHALAIKVGDTELDKDDLRDIELMVSVCAGLVTVDEESDVIRLAHYTTQQYFEQKQKQLFSDANIDIATACVTYLSFDNFRSGVCKLDYAKSCEDINEIGWQFKQRLHLYPLYNYASCNWGHHVQEAPTFDEKLILAFLSNDAKVSASAQALMILEGLVDGLEYQPRTHGSHHMGRLPDLVSGLHLAAWFGLREAITMLLRDGYDPNTLTDSGETPLIWAAKTGQHMVVQQLLDAEGIDPN